MSYTLNDYRGVGILASMDSTVHISEAARQLGVTPQHLRILEWQGRIPPARRDFNGRIYTAFDIALLKSMGIGARPRRLREVGEVLERVW
jgi:DNA-binding transcriptional MerR regulator